jgi:hypothetical protein
MFIKKCFLLILSIEMFFSCSKEINEHLAPSSCQQAMISKYGMVSYSEGDMYCMGLQKYTMEGAEYYFIDNCTADQAFMPFDCDEKFYFTVDGTINGKIDMRKQEKFFQQAVFVGIVGILK